MRCLGSQSAECLKKVHIAIYRLRVDGWIQIALISPPTFTVKTPVIQVAPSKGHYFALRHEKAAKPLEIKNMNTKTLWMSTGLEQEVIEDSQDFERSMFRGAGESFYTPLRRKSGSNIEDLLRSASTSKSEEIPKLLRSASSKKEEDLERFLCLAPPAEEEKRMEKGQKKFWRCPLCSYELEIQKGVSSKITQHIFFSSPKGKTGEDEGKH